ncbi:hypothetical protein K1T71_002653 [Dendrolimus kikuchii]|uniref:Uncharacterized protein n=1 Tax=Dendrolimus kikuchii TaxID=765133 RepID=A0ACC1DDK6_9NEOP|nr:hypothetical protein K1T71_002653 [Dendrolimus kikuchii]
MYYIDSQRTLTRRESSLVSSYRKNLSDEKTEFEIIATARGQSIAPPPCNSLTSFYTRPKGSVQKELVTILLASMLECIVDSWEVIVVQKPEESTPNIDFGKSSSEATLTSKKRKNIAKPTKKSRSKMDLSDGGQESIQQSWWSSPDERAIIRFRNGNIYEGNTSMKCMQGGGRFQWADGTVYLGQFKDNEIIGKGAIQWKDDTWYEGDFAGNLRHGKGIYVDSRKQRSYAGGWHCGTKHGMGVVYYTETFRNSYDGEWVYNVRHGFGSREYSKDSGYKGEWDKYVREGKGLMIWPNHDFYKGEWKNGVMSGYGIYIWDAYYNNSLSLPSINAYRGLWEKGERHGYGVLNLGLGLGSHYKGDFKNNKKHGTGKFVTNNGLILQDKKLFIDDNIGSLQSEDNENTGLPQDTKKTQHKEPYKFDICDNSLGLLYHIDQAIKNIDKEEEIRINLINDYLEKNHSLELGVSISIGKEDIYDEANSFIDIDFEESSLRKSLRCYENELKNIYYKYATICNKEEIYFTPVLIRLYLWQLYFDCNVHEKGLYLIEIDNIFYRNPEWIARTPHNPFEKIYFWQFLHSLISVASRLYTKRTIPSVKPDTILANALRTFMERDVLPSSGRRKGHLAAGYASFVPLRGTYELYRSLGEPHTVRTFLCAVRRPPHDLDYIQPPLVELTDDKVPLGRNVYIFGDEITFITDDNINTNGCDDCSEEYKKLKLFNFGNLSSRAVIKIFSRVFPELSNHDKIMNLDIEITFFEFFEAFISCAEESIRIKDEELKWREKFSLSKEPFPPNPVQGHKTK